MPPPGREQLLRLARWLDFRGVSSEQLIPMLGENFRDINRVLADLRKFQIQTQGERGNAGQTIEWLREQIINNSLLLWKWNGRDTSQFGERVDTGPGVSTLSLAVDSTSYETPALLADGQVTAGATAGGSQWAILDFVPSQRFRLEYRVDTSGFVNNGQWIYFGLAESDDVNAWALHLTDLVNFASRRILHYEGGWTAIQADVGHGVTWASGDSVENFWHYSGEEELSSPPKFSFAATAYDNDAFGGRGGRNSDVTGGTPSADWEGKKLRRLVFGIHAPAGGITSNANLRIRDIRILRHPADLELLSSGDTGWLPRRVVPTEPTL